MSVDLRHVKFEDMDPERFEKVDLVFADPPDNLGLAYDGYGDDMPDEQYEVMLGLWLNRCCQITSGPVFFTFNERWIGAVESAIRGYKLYLHQRCFWHFTFGQNSGKRYTPSVRPLYWLNNGLVYPDEIKVPSARQVKYGDKRAKAGGRMPDNLSSIEIDPDDPVWAYSRVCGTFREKRRWHICQMPELLLERVIKGHSKPGDTILDPFVGSGTTAYVGDRLGRHVIGLDQSQYYLDQIKAELERREGEAA